MGAPAGVRPGRTAAAVALLLVMLGAAWLLLRAPRLVFRPPSIRPITAAEVPGGETLILAWEGGGPPYDVLLTSAAGDPVWRAEGIPKPMVEVPREVSEPLSGGRYRWRVEGLDARGRPFQSDWFPLAVVAPEPEVVPASRSRGGAQRRR